MNYKKVIKHFKSGKLNKKKHIVIMDNADGWIGLKDWDGDDDATYEQESSRLEAMYGRGAGYSDLVDILQAAGVPADWC